MDYLSLMLRWLHIGSAIILVGGIVFWRSTLLPALETLAPSDRDELQTTLRQRWSRWVMLTSGLLLISGLVNAVLNMKQYEFAGNLYHTLVTVKLMLALTLFWIASVLSGSSVLAQRWRPKTKFWLNVGLVLAVLLVAVAGIMKKTDRTPKGEAPIQSVLSSTALSLTERT